MAERRSDWQRKIADLTECSICTETFVDPRALPCLHTFCFRCIRSFIRKTEDDDAYLCPLCRCEFDVPGRGVCDFPKNFYVDSLLELEKEGESLPNVRYSSSRCDICAELGTRPQSLCSAVWYCADCDQNLCEHCFQCHKRVTSTTKHHLVPSSIASRGSSGIKTAQTRFCERHPEKVTELFCLFCREAACTMCYLSDHNGHKCAAIRDTGSRTARPATTLTARARDINATVATMMAAALAPPVAAIAESAAAPPAAVTAALPAAVTAAVSQADARPVSRLLDPSWQNDFASALASFITGTSSTATNTVSRTSSTATNTGSQPILYPVAASPGATAVAASPAATAVVTSPAATAVVVSLAATGVAAPASNVTASTVVFPALVTLTLPAVVPAAPSSIASSQAASGSAAAVAPASDMTPPFTFTGHCYNCGWQGHRAFECKEAASASPTESEGAAAQSSSDSSPVRQGAGIGSLSSRLSTLVHAMARMGNLPRTVPGDESDSSSEPSPLASPVLLAAGPIHCNGCGKDGHYSRWCRNKQQCRNCGCYGHKENACSRETRETKCYDCNEMGHVAQDCPAKEPRRERAA